MQACPDLLIGCNELVEYNSKICRRKYHIVGGVVPKDSERLLYDI